MRSLVMIQAFSLAMVAALQPLPPPIADARKLSLSYKTIAQRAALGVTAAFDAGHRRVSVDIPQISSVDRSTTARKFEDDSNWLLNLIEMLGGGKAPTAVGRKTDIMEGGFEHGGDYLSDEGLYGFRWQAKGSVITAVGNSEIDSSALRELGSVDDVPTGKLLLFNCGLDRLSFFDKIGLQSFDDVEVAYKMQRVGAGFVSRQFPEDFCAWRQPADGGAPVLVAESAAPMKPQDAEAAIRRG